MSDYDCAVIGAGMVGATTALALADIGLKVVLIDKYPVTDFSPEQAFDLRVSAISLASEQLLTQLGAWQQLHDWRLCPYQRLGVWEQENAYTEFNSDDIQQAHLGHIVENRLLQLSLWQQVQQQSKITLLCPEQLQGFEQLADEVKLTLKEQVLTAKLLIASDGANSQVRSLAQIGTTGWDYQQSAMLIHVETSLEQQDITWQQFFQTGPVAMLPLPGNNASLVWYHQKAEIKRLSGLSNDALTAEIHQHFPRRLGNVKVINKAPFNLTRRHANQYVKGRVVLLGDAAHTINPLAGQGVNLGFKDVKALQLALATAIGEGESWYSAKTLSRYESARRTDNLLMMSTMDALYKTFSHPSPIIKGLRNLGLMAVNHVPVLNKQIKNKALAYACGLS